MGASGFSLGESKAGQALRQLQGGPPAQLQGGGGGEEGDKHAYPLPGPRDLVLLELALEKLEGKVREKVTQEEARAVARVCWEKAEKTANRLCEQAEQKDYPSTALRRLLLRVYQRVGDASQCDVQENAWASQSALHMLGPEIFHLARTTSRREVKRFFIECGQLAKELADQQDPRRPTGRGLAVFLERVICFAERYAVEQELKKQARKKQKK